MGNYLGFFSSCTSFVHVVEKPLRIYRIIRIFSKSVPVFSCTSFVHVAGGTKTTSKCCFWTTGEDHLMSRNGSDGEFSGRVTEASRRRSKKKPLRIYRIIRIFSRNVPVLLCTFFVHRANRLPSYLPRYPSFLSVWRQPAC